MGIPTISTFNNQFLINYGINQDNELTIGHSNKFDLELSYEEVIIDSYVAKNLGKHSDGKLSCHEWTRTKSFKFENLKFIRKGNDFLNQSIFKFEKMKNIWETSLKENNIPNFDNLI